MTGGPLSMHSVYLPTPPYPGSREDRLLRELADVKACLEDTKACLEQAEKALERAGITPAVNWWAWLFRFLRSGQKGKHHD